MKQLIVPWMLPAGIWMSLVCVACAQAPTPQELRVFFQTQEIRPVTAWEHWLRHRPPMRKLLLQRPPDISATLLNTAAPIPSSDPFAENMTLYREGYYQLGVSALHGFNLRKAPRNLPQLLRLLRLRNLLRLHEWIQPESNPLRLQNVIGLSFYFYF